MTAVQAEQRHQPCEIRHRDDIDWETIRWPGETGKMLFHPRPERPTEPNAGILRLEPGAHHPLHNHDFAQLWYVLSGTFVIGGKTVTGKPHSVVFAVIGALMAVGTGAVLMLLARGLWRQSGWARSPSGRWTPS